MTIKYQISSFKWLYKVFQCAFHLSFKIDNVLNGKLRPWTTTQILRKVICRFWLNSMKRNCTYIYECFQFPVTGPQIICLSIYTYIVGRNIWNLGILKRYSHVPSIFCTHNVWINDINHWHEKKNHNHDTEKNGTNVRTSNQKKKLNKLYKKGVTQKRGIKSH